MKKITTPSISGADVKYYNQGPAVPAYAHQRTQADKKNRDPASACFASCHYPIPSVISSRVRDNE